MSRKLHPFPITISLVIILINVTISAVAYPEDPPNGKNPAPNAIVDTIFVPKNTSASVGPYNVRKAGDHGCNDYFAIFRTTYPNLPDGVWATNAANQAHINNVKPHPGLNGYFSCDPGGYCYTYLCTKGDWPASAWSVRIVP
ncbi:MAG: hypothetical protein QXP01_08050 [Candidatus Hadarchaeum sp.]